ncbi:MAG: hypothetical protein SV377_00105 [Halobacteria archaeon]|nr:hypothetical protein [Halobacteria archaeon]
MRNVVLLLIVVISLLVIPSIAINAGAQTATEEGFTSFTIHVHENGNATWTVEYREPLQNQRQEEDFREFMEDFEEGNATIFVGIEDLRDIVREGENITGRSMSIEGFNRNVVIQNTVSGKIGIARVTFKWTNFSARHNESLLVGDVLNGFIIGSNQRLVIEYDTNLTLKKAVPDPDLIEQNRLRWDGKRVFEPGNPEIVLGLNTTDENGSDSDPPDDPNPNDPGENGNGSGQNDGSDTNNSMSMTTWMGLVAGLLVAGFIGGAISNHYLQAKMGEEARITEVETEDQGDEDEVPPELLTDEDRIIHMLQENGGRMKQVDIVNKTDWSKSKVSMVLSDMEDEGTISKLRLGRENIIELESEGKRH